MTKNENIRQRNNKNQRHGYWEVYYYHDRLHYKCYFVNDEESGYEEYYTFSNKLELRFHI